MKTIIVATDFSNNAANALEYAGALAGYTNSRIILFNAFQLPLHASNTLLPAEAFDELLKENKVRLQKIASAISEKYKIVVDVETTFEIVTDSLSRLVAKVNADLVVMGMHVVEWTDRIFGNTTTAVIRDANYPVLVVPQNASFKGVKRILYAFDNNCLFFKNRLSTLKDFASNFKAEVQVFHVEKQNSRRRSTAVVPEVEIALRGVEHYYKDVEENDVIEGVEKGIKEFEADVLAMVPHKLTFWEGMLNQSKTRAMALRTQIPLLVLPNPLMTSYN